MSTDRFALPVRRRRLPLLAAALTAALVVLLALGASARTARAETVQIAEGTVEWGFKASWRRYIGEPGITLSDGVTRAADGGFVWPIAAGAYDTETRALDLRLGGRVHFTAHDGLLDATLSNLRLRIGGDEAEVRADVRSKDMAGEWVSFTDGPLATLDLAPASVAVAGGSTTWSGVTTAITEEGGTAFTYSAGTPLDELRLTYSGPGGKPDLGETWTPPATVHFATAPVSSLLPALTYSPFATRALPDPGAGVVHLTGAGGPDTPGNRVIAVDAAGGERITVSGVTSGSRSAIDRARHTVFVGGNGNLTAYVWDGQTRTYGEQLLHTSASGTALEYNAARETLMVASDSQLVTVTRDGGGAFAADTRRLLGAGSPVRDVDVDADGARLAIVYIGDQRVQQLDPDGADLRLTPVPGLDGRAFTQLVIGEEGRAWVAESGGTGIVQRLQKNAAGRYEPAGDPIRAPGTVTTLVAADDGARRVYGVAPGSNAVYAFEARGLVGSFATAGPTGSANKIDVAPQADGSLLFTHPHATWANPGNPMAPWVLGRATPDAVSPAIDAQPADRTVRLLGGDSSATASFTVAATGDPAPQVRWQSRIGGAGRFRDLAGQTAATLAVEATPADDGRQYRAVLSNAGGELASEPATLTVLHAPAVVQQPEPVTVTEGEDAVLKTMPSGNPAPEIAWQVKTGGFWVPVEADGDELEVGGEQGGFLTVKRAALAQSGAQFRARLSSDLGTTYTRAVSLTVTRALTEPVTFGGGHVDWGVSERFRCYVVGSVARGGIELSGGVTRRDGTLATGSLCDGRNAGSEAFRFPVRGGSYDPVSGRLEAALDGAIRFWGHAHHVPGSTTPQLDTRLSALRLVVEGGVGTIYADAVGATMERPEEKRYGEVALARVDVAGIGPVRTAAGLDWAAAPTTLSAAGAEVFGSYPAGTAFDPIALSLAFGQPRVDPQPEPDQDPQPQPGPQPRPAKATISAAKSGGRPDARRIATVATLTCPAGASACAVRTPARVRVRIAGRRHAVRVLAPKRIAGGKRATVRVQLTRAALARLAGRRTTVAVAISVTPAGGTAATRTVRVMVRGAARKAAARSAGRV
jgi:Htaa